MFSTSGKFCIAQHTLSEQARKAIFSLKSHTRKFHDLKPDLMCMLFDKMIVPILNYGSEIWGFDDANEIERVHVQFCKSILKLRRNTANFYVYGELGRRPLVCKRYLRVIKYWLKIVMYGSKPLIQETYKMLYREVEANNTISNWVSRVKNLLTTMGFGDVWLHQGVANTELFLKIFEQRVNDIALQNWRRSVNNSNESLLYRELKTTLEYSPYLKLIVQPKHRVAFTKFVTKNHSLSVVTGNWHKPRPIPYRERVCDVCDKIDDEYHAMFECSKFSHIRKRYISTMYRSRPSMYKFIQLLTTTDATVLNDLAIFIYKISVQN